MTNWLCLSTLYFSIAKKSSVLWLCMRKNEYKPYRNSNIDILSRILHKNNVSIYQKEECGDKSPEYNYADASQYILNSFMTKMYENEDARNTWKLEFKKEVSYYFHMVLNKEAVDSLVCDFNDSFYDIIPNTGDAFMSKAKKSLINFNELFYANVDDSFLNGFANESVFFTNDIHMPVYVKDGYMEIRIKNNVDAHIYLNVSKGENDVSQFRVVNHDRKPKVREEINTI